MGIETNLYGSGAEVGAKVAAGAEREAEVGAEGAVSGSGSLGALGQLSRKWRSSQITLAGQCGQSTVLRSSAERERIQAGIFPCFSL